ncbi:tyrosine-protein kinase domain-containing protein [Geitlerinema sp. PCC 9228]|jgi:capsular exopolysaccharide synthesis family protein|uniref:GumC family protein n=1 Tax=Geitlerinema sp. PCC 9228 TaxID=111611 RepID=UPI0008F9ACF3|nr:tyrosine-protein kinase domain-containing protein [Geitlerinema sp. PCC 9228]
MAPSIVKRYFIALGKYKWVGTIIFILVASGSGLMAFLQDPPSKSYVARGVLTQNSSPATVSATGEQILQRGKQLSQEVLLEDNVIVAVANQVNLPAQQVYNRTNLDLPGEDSEQAVRVSFRDRERDRAETAVRALMEAMVEQSRLLNVSRLKSIIESLEERLPEVRSELEDAQAALERFERVKGAAIISAKEGSYVQAITSSEQQQRQISLQLEGVNQQIQSLSQRLGMTPDQAYVAQALSADSIVANLRSRLSQVETQMSILRERLQPQHPQMVELEKQKQALENLLQQRAREVIGGSELTAPLGADLPVRQASSLDPARQQMANALVSLQTQRDTLQRQLEAARKTEQRLRQEYADIPNLQLERERLANKVAVKKQLYNKIQSSLLDARAAEAETISNLRIASDEVRVDTKVESQTSPLILVGGGSFLGLLLGGGIIFLLSALEGKFYTMEEIRGAFTGRDIPVLGILPQVPRWEDGEEMPIFLDPYSPYLQYWEQLRSNLILKSQKPPRAITISSLSSGEGKTFTAYNLAIASARAGWRTLLLELDLRSSSATEALHVRSDASSAIEPLRYYDHLNRCMQLVPSVENLYVVPSPGLQRQPATVLESSELQNILQEVKNRFDFVIVDTPSLSSCNDAWLVNPYTDGMLLVTRPQHTKPGLVSEFIDPLTEVEEDEEMPILGVAINGVEISVPASSYDDELEGTSTERTAASETALSSQYSQQAQVSNSSHR